MLTTALACAATAGAQSAQPGIDFEHLALDRPGPVSAAAPNWRVVGGVEAPRRERLRLETSPGTGVLANVAGEGSGASFVTPWEHGDIELELEYLVPAGSNSGLYLQGRYELQILDSWGVRNPTFGASGGIYQRWDESRPEAERGYEGTPPRANASRAPGLWQQLKIHFRAPRFDASGRKVENARFVRVEHNGLAIHENVEVTGPTRGAAFPDERATGPLLIQGDHGPVAFRNVRYKRYTGEHLALSGLRYRAYRGEFASLAAATAGAPTREGTATAISTAVAEVGDKFAVAYDGFIDVPTSGTHAFELNLEWVTPDPGFTNRVVGGGRLVIGGREVLVHDGLRPTAAGRVELTAGRHPFSLVVHKNRPWIDQMRSISLWVEGPGIQRHPLHEIGPVAVPNPIMVQPAARPVVLRSFVDHGGTVLTHAVSVGDPTGVHYAYDTQRGALLNAWRGPFAETTEMWHDRGERQVARPLGAPLSLPRALAVAVLAAESAPWPDSAASASYRFRGYTLDAAGRPTFQYSLGSLEVDDAIRPAEEGAALRRELTIRVGEGGGAAYVRLAEGARIRRIGDGSYVVGDLGHYVELEPGTARPVIRDIGGRQELLVRVDPRGGSARVAYSLVW